MKRENSDSQLNKIGLIKVFSNMDTQSAIVAAVVISLITFLGAGFLNLCNYIYWNAYFSNFNIPLAYIDEAIIHENGGKYITVLSIPVLIFFWWLLTAVENALQKLGRALAARRRRPVVMGRVETVVLKILLHLLFISVMALLLMGGLTLLMELGSAQKFLPVLILYAETVVFLLWTYCKATLGRKFTFSRKTFLMVRVVGVFVLVYLVLGSVYYAGSFANYSRNSAQSLQIVYDPGINYNTLNGEEKIQTQLVLLETADYYYVTDVTLSRQGGLAAQIWSDDSYRFIDKINCPVKSVYAHLSYIGGRRKEPLMNRLFPAYMCASMGFAVAFISLMSIPARDEKEQLSAADNAH